MKKILSILSMLAVCLLMASCQTDADKACSEMAKNMKDGKVDAVAKTAAELYSQKDDLSIDNLSDLAIAFHYLAQKESSVRKDATSPFRLYREVARLLYGCIFRRRRQG